MSTRVCEDCGEPVSARRKRCPECKRADHARAEAERRAEVRDRNSGAQDESPANEPRTEPVDYVTAGSIPGQRYQFKTQYAPRPAAAAPEAIDYTQGGHDAPGHRRLDLAGISNAVRRDRAKLEAALRGRDFGAEDESEMSSWTDLMQRNSRPDDGRTVMFDKPAPGSPRRQARPDEGRTLSSMLRTGREPNVDYLGRSTRRPRSWR